MLLLLLLLPLTTSTTLRETLRIPPTTPLTTPTTLTFPPTNPIPLLRSLTIYQNSTATTPYLPTPGIAKRTKTTLHITFPRILIRLHITNSHPLTLRGSIRHTFTRPPGLRLHSTPRTVTAAVASLTKALESDTTPNLVAVVDHAKAAAEVGLKLAPSSVVVFGNPLIGSRLWLQNPKIGIELPLEILIASSPLGTTYVAWNAASLLKSRFALTDVDDVLRTIDGALANLADVAAGREFTPAEPGFDEDRFGKKGVRTVRGEGDAVEAFERLVAAVSAPPVRVAFQVPHDAAAERAGVDVGGRVEKVVVFGNANVGTRVMQEAFTAAIDLPLKMGVWTRKKGGRVFVGYTKASFIGRRHGVEVPQVLEGALRRFADFALGV